MRTNRRLHHCKWFIVVFLCSAINIVSIEKLVFGPCARFRYVARNHVDAISATGSKIAPELNSLIPVKGLNKRLK